MRTQEKFECDDVMRVCVRVCSCVCGGVVNVYSPQGDLFLRLCSDDTFVACCFPFLGRRARMSVCTQSSRMEITSLGLS
jgi:hypothetical protein